MKKKSYAVHQTNARSMETMESDGVDPFVMNRIIDKAIDCFSRFGVHRTRMEDVAQAVDMSRPLVYRYFATRQELIDAVVLRQINAIINATRSKIDRLDNFSDIIALGSVELIIACRADNLFMELFRPAAHARLSWITNPGSIAFPAANALWEPILDKARARGELVSNHENERIITWLNNVYLLFLLRENDKPEEILASIRDFIVPALARKI